MLHQPFSHNWPDSCPLCHMLSAVVMWRDLATHLSHSRFTSVRGWSQSSFQPGPRFESSYSQLASVAMILSQPVENRFLRLEVSLLCDAASALGANMRVCNQRTSTTTVCSSVSTAALYHNHAGCPCSPRVCSLQHCVLLTLGSEKDYKIDCFICCFSPLVEKMTIC